MEYRTAKGSRNGSLQNQKAKCQVRETTIFGKWMKNLKNKFDVKIVSDTKDKLPTLCRKIQLDNGLIIIQKITAE